MSDAQADALGWFVQYAEDMGPHPINPPLDPRMQPQWALRGHIVGVDQLGMIYDHVCYGFLAEGTPGVFVAVIRGTSGFLEWGEDAEFLPEPYPQGGHVESGFYELYKRLYFRALDGTLAPLISGILGMVKSGHVTVVGHSLGSALGTITALELSMQVGTNVDACLFASPRVGDSDFVGLVDRNLINYRLFNYVNDSVPQVPAGLGFVHLPRAEWITPENAQAKIRDNPFCNHHIICYEAMRDYRGGDWPTVGPKDESEAACIIGPWPL